MKLNIGCGKSVIGGFDGVDSINFGQKYICDVRQGLPFDDNTVDEVISGHFVEHLTGNERVGFFNELYRVMKRGAVAHIATPDYSHASAYGDPTHQWPPMSEWYVLYLNKTWRDRFAPHVKYTCNFKHDVEKRLVTVDGYEVNTLIATLSKI